jgi:hypothetical protein
LGGFGGAFRIFDGSGWRKGRRRVAPTARLAGLNADIKTGLKSAELLTVTAVAQHSQSPDYRASEVPSVLDAAARDYAWFFHASDGRARWGVEGVAQERQRSRMVHERRLPQQPIWFAKNQSTMMPPGTPSIHAMKYFMHRGEAT